MLCEIELFYCLAFIMALYPVVALDRVDSKRDTSRDRKTVCIHIPPSHQTIMIPKNRMADV